MNDEYQRLSAAIAALESQRALLGDAVVDAALAPMRDRLQTLQSDASHDQQLKFVTVLFADIVDSTRLGRDLDPEDTMALVDGAMRRFTRVVEAHGGVVRNFMGDGLLALFGFPVAHEHDAEQAVRAGLAMLAEAQAYAVEVEARLPHAGFQIRVGINTGHVILGGGIDRDTNALGMATSLAARMQSAAPPGSLLITHDTYRQVRGIFEVEPQPPLQVKGREEPVQTYLVRGARPRSFRLPTRGVEGIETRMVGRDAELKRLQDALHAVVADGTCRLLTVTGEAGLGKSRLVYEFDAWVDLLPQKVYHFKARAHPTSQNLAYSLLRDLFSFRFAIHDSDSPPELRAKLERGLAEGFSDVARQPMQGAADTSTVDLIRRAEVLAQLLGYDLGMPSLPGDTVQLRDQALLYLAGYFRGLAARYPVLVLLEDIHWADESSLDAVASLVVAAAQTPLLVVCAARPALFDRRPNWGEGPVAHTRLNLKPLENRESRLLVGEILRMVDEIPPALRDLIVNNAEGNPFYIEELIKMLVEDGVIVKGPKRWRVAGARLAGVRVPPTLTGVLQARLDSLRPAERMLLQRAAVVGRTFWDAALDFLEGLDARQPESGRTLRTEEILAALRRREMVFQHEQSAFEHTLEYLFKHALLRDVTYESVLKRDRRAYHARTATWLEEITQRSGHVDEYAALIAEHHERAGEAATAVTWYWRAGNQAASQGASAEAIRCFTRALELGPGAPLDDRCALLLARAQAYDLQGAREAQLADLEAATDLADALGDLRRRAEVALRRAEYAEAVADYPGAIASARVAIDLAHSAGDLAIEANGQRIWGMSLWRQAGYVAARVPYEQALRLAGQASGLRETEAGALRGLGLVSEALGDYDQARAQYEQALRIYREIGDVKGEGRALNDLGVLSYNQNDLRQARTYYETALHLKHETGDRRGESTVLHNLANIHHQQGDYATARVRFEEALRLCHETSDAEGEAAALLGLGTTAMYTGDWQGARATLDAALRITRQIGDRHGEADVLVALSQLSGWQGAMSAAVEYARQALEIALETGAPNEEAYALSALANAHLAQQDLNEAADTYARALELRRALGEPPLASQCLAGLAAVALARGDLPRAQALAEEALAYIEAHGLDGMDDPFTVYLTCYRVLLAAGDPRAALVLQTAHTHLQTRAGRLDHPDLRRAYLEDVPPHRALVDARQRHHQA